MTEQVRHCRVACRLAPGRRQPEGGSLHVGTCHAAISALHRESTVYAWLWCVQEEASFPLFKLPPGAKAARLAACGQVELIRRTVGEQAALPLFSLLQKGGGEGRPSNLCAARAIVCAFQDVFGCNMWGSGIQFPLL